MSRWSQSPELPEVEGGELQRLFAEALQNATAEASHLGSVATTNDFIRAQNMLEQGGEEQLAFIATVEGKRVDGLLHLLREMDRAMLVQCGVLNELIAQTDDAHFEERLQLMQRAILQNEDIVRATIEHVEQGR